MKFLVSTIDKNIEIEGEEIRLLEYSDIIFVFHKSITSYENVISEYSSGTKVVSGYLSKDTLISNLRETLNFVKELGIDIYTITKDFPKINPAKIYIITGVDKRNRRFKPIVTPIPQHYNIWKGTVWMRLSNNKRKRMYTINN